VSQQREACVEALNQEFLKIKYHYFNRAKTQEICKGVTNHQHATIRFKIASKKIQESNPTVSRFNEHMNKTIVMIIDMIVKPTCGGLTVIQAMKN
jgi:hypothetical protein